jgi:hypothetical protein
MITESGVTETAHRTINDAAIMLQRLHADAIKAGIRANLELADIREETA